LHKHSYQYIKTPLKDIITMYSRSKKVNVLT